MNKFENIPTELKESNQWILWRLEDRGKPKPDKIPYQANNKKAETDDPKTWTNFNTVYNKFNSNGKTFSGLGYVLSVDDPYTIIDFDNVISDGKLNPEVKKWVDKFKSYTEYSQSKSGLHIIVKGKKPGDKCKKIITKDIHYEIYDKLRYFALTGDLFENYSQIEERQEAINEFYSSVFVDKPRVTPAPVQNNNISLDAQKIIELLTNEKNGKAARLFAGDTSEYRGDDSSADIALCNKIAFYTQDEAEIDSIFRQSGLYREKWERADYREKTIGKALAGLSGTYDPNHNKPLKKKPQKPVIKQEEIPGMVIYSDMWNSKRMVEFFGDNIRYCQKWKEWMHWNGKNWETDETGQIQEIGKKTVRSFYSMAANMGDDKERSKFVNHIKISENLNRRKAMIEGAQSEPGIPVKPEEFDGDKWLLNVSNGTLNLKTMELQPHNRADYITKIIDTAYNPDATYPTWEAFLNRIFNGNSNFINFIQKAIGYSLTGSTQEQCIFILHGSGANGKSTFITTIKELLGEYAQQTHSETLMQKKHGNGSTNDLAMLRGARFISSVETEEGKAFAEVLIKQLSGDDVITARFLFKEFFNFRFEGKIFVATNHKPKIQGTDYAIWRRIKLIPFDITIPEAERDPFLLEKLRQEYEGILKWAVDGCRLWLQEGLKAPEEVKAATEEYKNEMDVLGDFINECCVKGDRRYHAPASELYKKYCLWCEETGENKLSQRAFGLKLSERGYKKEKSYLSKNRGNIIYTGIGLLEEKADSEPETDEYYPEESPF